MIRPPIRLTETGNTALSNQHKNEKQLFSFQNNNLEGHLALMDGIRGAPPVFSNRFVR